MGDSSNDKDDQLDGMQRFYRRPLESISNAQWSAMLEAIGMSRLEYWLRLILSGLVGASTGFGMLFGLSLLSDASRGEALAYGIVTGLAFGLGFPLYFHDLRREQAKRMPASAPKEVEVAKSAVFRRPDVQVLAAGQLVAAGASFLLDAGILQYLAIAIAWFASFLLWRSLRSSQ